MFVLCLPLLACPPPTGETTVDTQLVSAAQTFRVSSSGENANSYEALVTAESAPAGEYMLFSSSDEPTAIAHASELDQHTVCPDDQACVVDGIGRLEALARHTVAGPLRLSALITRDGGVLDGPRWFTLVRQGDTQTPVRVTTRIIMESTSGGCGAATAPEVTPTDLD